MFSLVAGRAQSRGRSDEPIRTQRERSASRDRPIPSRRSKRRSEKESDSSNNYPPIVVGPLTTNQDLADVKGEKIYNLPLMIQQPFLREKKEPIKVDISVKLIPKPRKKDKKRRDSRIQEIILDDNRGVKNSISMEVVDGDINVLNETVEILESEDNEPKVEERSSPTVIVADENVPTENETVMETEQVALQEESVQPQEIDFADDVPEPTGLTGNPDVIVEETDGKDPEQIKTEIDEGTKEVSEAIDEATNE